jgi:hypothetical protein
LLALAGLGLVRLLRDMRTCSAGKSGL